MGQNLMELCSYISVMFAKTDTDQFNSCFNGLSYLLGKGALLIY